jgi:DNA topoisomerase-1
MVTENLSAIDARLINSIPLFDDEEGRHIVVRVGRFGPYLQRQIPGATDEQANDKANRVSIPEGVAPDELTPETRRPASPC